MTIEQIREYISTHKKGQFVHVKFYKELPVLAAYKGQCQCYKVTTSVYRWGVDYNNLKKVQQKREIGSLPEAPQGLPWGEWMEYPIFIKHKDSVYIRLVVEESVRYLAKTDYYIVEDDIPGKFDRDTVQQLCRKMSSGNPPDIITIKLDNLLEFGDLKK